MGLIPKSLFQAEIAQNMYNRATITLNNLNNYTNFQKKELIKNLVTTKNSNLTDLIALMHRDTFNWTTYGYFDAKVLPYTDGWEDGTIHLELDYKTSNEAFEGTYGIRLPGTPNATSDLSQLNTMNDTSRLWPYNLFQNSLTPTPPPVSSSSASRRLIAEDNHVFAFGARKL